MSLVKNKYKKYNLTKKWLKENKFIYLKESDEDNQIYEYTFPVWKYKDTATLECRLKIFFPKGHVKIDVIDLNDGLPYRPFYIETTGYSKFISEINSKIINKLNTFEIKEVRRKRYAKHKN